MEMSKYQITYGHSQTKCGPGTLTLAAENDAEAVKEARKFVADGYRDATWAALDLSDGRSYNVQNVRGNAVGAYA